MKRVLPLLFTCCGDLLRHKSLSLKVPGFDCVWHKQYFRQRSTPEQLWNSRKGRVLKSGASSSTSYF